MKCFTPTQNPHPTCVRAVPINILGILVLSIVVFGKPVWAHEGGIAKKQQPPSAAMLEGEVLERFGSLANLVGRGEAAYKHMCSFCHGVDGNGGGKAMSYLYPWPRDFRKGVFKYRSTPTGSLPLDKDIYQVISLGVPGTAMPAWGQSLTEQEIWSLVAYVKTFSDRFDTETPKKPIELTSPPAIASDLIKKGESIYNEIRCGRCHGTDLKGDGSLTDNLYDIWDHRSFVYDLTNPNLFKWGFKMENIYQTLTSGVDGTPMKTYGYLTDEERWALAAFIDSRLNKKTYQKARFESDLHVKVVKDEIPLDPVASVWNSIPATKVHLLPLSARRNPINRVQVQAAVNDDVIAFRLKWDDLVPNRSSSRHQDFKDAVALQFALGDVLLHKHGHNEPFFGMGNRGKVVNIWQWRADWQQDIETKEKLEYATKGMDVDGMIFGGEVNPVDALNPFREVPVEELNAEGFGTLTPQPQTKQNVRGLGVWEGGTWTVVLIRSLDVLNKWDVKFNRDKDEPILMAFAVWDGASRDYDGRKSVAMWQRLYLPKQ